MDYARETVASAVASGGGKVTAAGTGAWITGLLTADVTVCLIGLAVTVLGFVVNAVFRWRDNRDKRREIERNIARIDAEEARAKERHGLEVQMMNTRLNAMKRGEGDPQSQSPLQPHAPLQTPGGPS